jgi:hypothetical protein
LVKADKT